MTIGYNVRDRIAYISFERRERHNALRDEDLRALSEAVRRLDADDTAEIAILFGQGGSFSSGGDVDARLQRSMDEGSTAGRTTEREAFLECDHWKPIIAAVHGYCLGHALATALLCDHVVAARNAKFQVTETKIGLAMPGLIPQLGSSAFAYDVAMTGRMFTAEEAMAGGALTRLAEDGEHISCAQELARQILDNPQTAVRSLVQVRRAMIVDASARFKAVAPAFDWATSSEAQAAVAARAHGSTVHPAESAQPDPSTI
jgi:enoyl-CoA hydratase/carnithine racemase